MPRNYKKKGTKVKWTAEEMSNALKDIRENKMKVYAAARKYGIPDQTL